MIESLDTRIAGHARALGLILITNHRTFGRIKSLKIKDCTN